MSYDSKYTGAQVEDAIGKALTAAQKADIPTKISDLDNDAGSISYLGIEYTLSDSDKVVSDVNEWVATSAPLTQRERAIVYGNGYYVVCGTSGDVAYSADANEWTKITPFTTGVLTSIAYGKGRFLAIDSLGAVWISYKNPYSWEQVDVTFDVILEAVIYANNRFIIVGASGLFAKSNNGLVWEVGNIDSVDKYSLTFGEGKYIAVGLNGSIFESTDGETWVDNSDSTFTQSIRTVAYGNGLFVCGGQAGAIRYSADGKVWTTATTNSTSTISYIRGIAYSNGRFYACMYTSAGKGEIWVSDDAATWTVQFAANGRLWAIMANDNILLSTGDSGTIYKLDLAVEWQDSEPEIVDGKYLWQRVYAGLTDGSIVYGENVCLINSTKFAAKQDAISDLDAIRMGAAKGATALQQHQSLDGYAKTADLATVATSGSYADLNDKPTIPAEQVNADWNATSGKAQILNKPTIPTVPNNVSAFNNDAGYITDETIFKESAAYGIDSDDITNWDGKISGDGTILKVVKVSELPSSPDANTLYIIA